MASPPSFDSFFNNQQQQQQQQQRPQQQMSQDSYQSDYPSKSYSNGSEQFGAIYAQQLGEEPLTSEPQGLHDQSMEILQPQHRQQNSQPHHAVGPNDARSSVERKDSVPFDPSSSSTLIASVSNDGSRPFDTTGNLQYQQQHDFGHQYAGNYQPQSSSSQQHYNNNYDYAQQQQQQHHQQQQQQRQDQSRSDFTMGGHGHGSSTDLYGQSHGSSTDLYGQASNHSNAPQQQQQGTWSSQEYWTQQNDVDVEADSRRASWQGNQHLGSTPGFEEQLNELQRIISNASSHGTQGDISRVASPFQAAGISAHTRHDSTSSLTHSPSPYTTPSMAAPSPPISNMHRASTSSLQGSPYTKPQSPPALIIPGNNGSQSPSFQPMAAAAPAPRPTVDTNQGGSSTSQFGNSLLPPVNPALEHLTGMAGISPIAPNVDGPMITIQPSTPISGLKDGGGHFDDALRRANAQWQAQHQQVQQSQQQSQQSSQQAQSGQSSSSGTSFAAPTASYQNSWTQNINLGGLEAGGHRPRAKSESYTTDGGAFERQAAIQLMQGPLAGYTMAQAMQGSAVDPTGQQNSTQWSDINAWRMNQAGDNAQFSTLDPRTLPGSETGMDLYQQVDDIRSQQRARLAQLNTEGVTSETFNYEPGQFSPTSMAFYQQLGVPPPNTQAAYTGLLPPTSSTSRRRSFAEGTHHAAGAGTPGYGVEFTAPGALTGRIRGAGMGHRRAVKSEDYGRPGQPGTGWGMGAGGSTADFLNAITNPDDGTLLPPAMRGRSLSHSRHSSASSQRSASPALSVSSQGSSFSHHSHMDMPDGVSPDLFGNDQRSKVAKMKVTSQATEVASQSRRTNSGIFHCPIPGCNSTFTRHFNLKGHLRSHNDERPYKCEYEGCPKAIVGFARQHDCKRHMLLHEGQRPFECEGCGKRFARLDALTRHHKSDQGQQCAISHPLPVNPDGSAMSESQYKAYRMQQVKEKGGRRNGASTGASASASADERE